MDKNRFGKILTLLSIITIALIGVCTTSSALTISSEQSEEEFHQTYDLSSGGTVSLKNLSGDIRITSWNENKVQVNATKKGNSKQFNLVKIEVISTSNQISINTIYPDRTQKMNLNVDVEYDIKVPKTVILDSIKAISGNISIKGPISGEITVDTISGNLTINNASSDVRAKTISGEIKLDNIEGDSRASTISGSINAQRLSRGLIANSISGNIIFSGEITGNSAYDCKTHSGDVLLTIPSNSNFNIKAKLYSGTFKTDHVLNTSANNNHNRNNISGSVGKGGATLYLSTFSGDIQIKNSNKK